MGKTANGSGTAWDAGLSLWSQERMELFKEKGVPIAFPLKDVSHFTTEKGILDLTKIGFARHGREAYKNPRFWVQFIAPVYEEDNPTHGSDPILLKTTQFFKFIFTHPDNLPHINDMSRVCHTVLFYQAYGSTNEEENYPDQLIAVCHFQPFCCGSFLTYVAVSEGLYNKKGQYGNGDDLPWWRRGIGPFMLDLVQCFQAEMYPCDEGRVNDYNVWLQSNGRSPARGFWKQVDVKTQVVGISIFFRRK